MVLAWLSQRGPVMPVPIGWDPVVLTAACPHLKATELVILAEGSRLHLWRGPQMAQGNALRPARGSWGHVAKLVRMLHMGLGPGTLGQLYDQLSSRPHRELAMPLPYLDHSTGERTGSRQAVQHPIVGETAIPPHFALLRSKAFPGKRPVVGPNRFP